MFYYYYELSLDVPLSNDQITLRFIDWKKAINSLKILICAKESNDRAFLLKINVMVQVGQLHQSTNVYKIVSFFQERPHLHK